MSLIYFTPIFLIIIFIIGWFFYDNSGKKRQIILLSKLDTEAIVDKQHEIKNDAKTNSLSLKLIVHSVPPPGGRDIFGRKKNHF